MPPDATHFCEPGFPLWYIDPLWAIAIGPILALVTTLPLMICYFQERAEHREMMARSKAACRSNSKVPPSEVPPNEAEENATNAKDSASMARLQKLHEQRAVA